MSLSDMSVAMAQTRPSWDFRRGTAGARILVELARDRGIGAEHVLAATGLTAPELADPDALIEAGQELAIARNLLAALGNQPGLGVEAGQRYTIGSLGIWGFALLTCPTVGDLLRLGTHYAALSFAFIHPRYELIDGGARVVLEDHEIPEDVRAFFVERELAKLSTLAPVVQDSLDGFSLETRFDGVRGRMMRERLPYLPLHVGREVHALVCRKPLDEPLPQSDQVTALALEHGCQELIDRRRRVGAFATRVRARLLVRPREMAEMDEIASELGVDERTLRRRLSAEGTSFRALVNDVRETLATELLTTGGLTVEGTAERLGYHDASGFSRAYTSWTGRRPGAVHRTAVEAADRSLAASRAAHRSR
jgi:AraC-like DNA-binding protein